VWLFEKLIPRVRL